MSNFPDFDQVLRDLGVTVVQALLKVDAAKCDAEGLLPTIEASAVVVIDEDGTKIKMTLKLELDV